MCIRDRYGEQIPTNAKLLASDFSASMLRNLVKKKDGKVADGDELWKRLQTAEIDAHKLTGISDESVSHSLSGFLYMLLGDPRKALGQTRRVLKNDGVMALSCWKGSQWIDMMNIINSVDAVKKWPGLPPAWTTIEGVKGELEAVGFSDVGAEEVDVAMRFDTYEEVMDLCGHKSKHPRLFIVFARS